MFTLNFFQAIQRIAIFHRLEQLQRTDQNVLREAIEITR